MVGRERERRWGVGAARLLQRELVCQPRYYVIFIYSHGRLVKKSMLEATPIVEGSSTSDILPYGKLESEMQEAERA